MRTYATTPWICSALLGQLSVACLADDPWPAEVSAQATLSDALAEPSSATLPCSLSASKLEAVADALAGRDEAWLDMLLPWPGAGWRIVDAEPPGAAANGLHYVPIDFASVDAALREQVDLPAGALEQRISEAAGVLACEFAGGRYRNGGDDANQHLDLSYAVAELQAGTTQLDRLGEPCFWGDELEWPVFPTQRPQGSFFEQYLPEIGGYRSLVCPVYESPTLTVDVGAGVMFGDDGVSSAVVVRLRGAF